MSSLLVLIPIAIIFITIAIKLFFWAIDDGQYDDLMSPGHSILFEDENPELSKQHRKKKSIDI